MLFPQHWPEQELTSLQAWGFTSRLQGLGLPTHLGFLIASPRFLPSSPRGPIWCQAARPWCPAPPQPQSFPSGCEEGQGSPLVPRGPAWSLALLETLGCASSLSWAQATPRGGTHRGARGGARLFPAGLQAAAHSEGSWGPQQARARGTWGHLSQVGRGQMAPHHGALG